MRTRSIVFLLLILCIPCIAAAQAPDRSGFFIGFGLGPGSFGGEDFEERTSSGSGYFRLGGALNDRLLLGGEVELWVKEENGVTVTNGGVNLVAYMYPDPTGGFYFKSGLGSASIEVDTGILGGARENGVSFTFGAGYDVGFGGKFALTPYGSFQYNKFGEGSANVLALGIGFNWY